MSQGGEPSRERRRLHPDHRSDPEYRGHPDYESPPRAPDSRSFDDEYDESLPPDPDSAYFDDAYEEWCRANSPVPSPDSPNR